MTVTLTSRPFDGTAYSEAEWGQMAKFWLGDGVLAGELNEFLVFADSSGLNAKVSSGRCWIQGFFGELAAQQTLTLQTADPTNPRIDRVVLQLDLVNNNINLTTKTGTASGSPAAPALTRTGTVYEISIGKIAVAAGATTTAAGNVTDERANMAFEGAATAPVCGYAYRSAPPARCLSTLRPTKWVVGGTVYEEDTGFVQINTGTYAVPVWTRAGPAAFAVPALTLGTANAIGAANSYMRSDATLAIFDATVPSTQAMGDAAVVGAAAFAARRDHKHAMPAFGTPTAVMGTAGAPGAAATAIRTDATLPIFDATVPTTSAVADAAAAGAAAFAARRDHVHGREASPHLLFYMSGSESRANNTLTDSTYITGTIAANSLWLFDLLLIVSAPSDVPDIKFTLTTVAGVGGIAYLVEYDDWTAGTPVPIYLSVGGFGTLTVVPLLAAVGIQTIRASGYIQHSGGSSTTFKLQWAQNTTTGGSPTNLYAPSKLTAHRYS